MTPEIGTMRFRPTPADDLPASPPPEVLAEVDAAWLRAGELAARNLELHFCSDWDSGRVIVEVRTLAGEVLSTISPSHSLEIMCGEAHV
jgi:hypothetical protein